MFKDRLTVLMKKLKSSTRSRCSALVLPLGGSAWSPPPGTRLFQLPRYRGLLHGDTEWPVYCSKALLRYTALIQRRRNGFTVAPPAGACLQAEETWSCEQHLEVMRALYVRTFRIANRRVGELGASASAQAMREVSDQSPVANASLSLPPLFSLSLLHTHTLSLSLSLALLTFFAPRARAGDELRQCDAHYSAVCVCCIRDAERR